MKPRIQWGRLLRRSLALFLATLAVWAPAGVQRRRLRRQCLPQSGAGPRLCLRRPLRRTGTSSGGRRSPVRPERMGPPGGGPVSSAAGNGTPWPAIWTAPRPPPPICPPGSPPRITTTSASRPPRPLPRRRTSLPAPWCPPAPRAMRCPGACTSTTAPGWTWIWPPPRQPP